MTGALSSEPCVCNFFAMTPKKPDWRANEQWPPPGRLVGVFPCPDAGGKAHPRASAHPGSTISQSTADALYDAQPKSLEDHEMQSNSWLGSEFHVQSSLSLAAEFDCRQEPSHARNESALSRSVRQVAEPKFSRCAAPANPWNKRSLPVTYGEQVDLACEHRRIVRRAGNELHRAQEL